MDHSDPYYLQFDSATAALVGSIKVIAAYGRAQHDTNQLCGCSYAVGTLGEKDKQLLISIHPVTEWIQHLVAEKAAFSVVNAQDHGVFTHRTGRTPLEFAKKSAQETFAAPAMTAPAGSLEDTVKAMAEH